MPTANRVPSSVADALPLPFGSWLKKQRRRLEWTQEQLAVRCSSATITIRRLEAGDLAPSQSLAQQLATVLDIPADDHASFIAFARGVSTHFETQAAQPSPAQAPVWPSATPVPKPVPPRYTLPTPMTALIGRQHELERCCALLRRSSVRLVTLVGPPGAGKTRLSLALAEQTQTDFADGVCFVPLASIRSPLLFGDALAGALGVRGDANEPISAALQDLLQDRQLLLVLDNFEQVVAAAPLVVELLQAAPGLKIVATSRTPLRIYGEHEFAVPPLALPSGESLPPLAELLRYSAVELFVQRAQAAQPAFDLDADNVQTIVQICATLDGLPLAIEMAAAQVKWHPPARLLTQLRRRLQVLTAGPRDRSPRQQTLAGAIEWSYDLLGAEERRLYNLFGVFVGGCTTAAATAVWTVGADQPSATEVAACEELLQALVEQSLLQIQLSSEDAARYLMLETLREYALERLAAGGDADAVRQRHARYYAELAASARPHLLQGDQQIAWFNRIAAEHGNVRAAMNWALESGDASVELALRLLIELSNYWDYRGDYREVRSWAEQALARQTAPTTLSAQALIATGLYAWRQGDIVNSRRLYEQALSVHRQLGDRNGIAWSLRGLGLAASEDDNYLQAESFFAESLKVFQEQREFVGVRMLLINLAALARKQGDYDRSEQYLRSTLPLLEQLGDKLGRRFTLTGLGRVALRRQQYQQAAHFFRESLEISWQMQDRRALATVLECVAAALGGLGDAVTGASLFGRAQALREEVGSPVYIDGKAEYERDVAVVRAALNEARFREAWAAGRSLSLEQAVALALEEA